MNVSYTMGLCMVNSGEATGCLTKHIEIIESDFSKFFRLISLHRLNIVLINTHDT